MSRNSEISYSPSAEAPICHFITERCGVSTGIFAPSRGAVSSSSSSGSSSSSSTIRRYLNLARLRVRGRSGEETSYYSFRCQCLLKCDKLQIVVYNTLPHVARTLRGKNYSRELLRGSRVLPCRSRALLLAAQPALSEPVLRMPMLVLSTPLVKIL